MAMRSVSMDIDATRLMGVDVDKVISYTFALGSALAAQVAYCGRVSLELRHLWASIQVGRHSLQLLSAELVVSQVR